MFTRRRQALNVISECLFTHIYTHTHRQKRNYARTSIQKIVLRHAESYLIGKPYFIQILHSRGELVWLHFIEPLEEKTFSAGDNPQLRICHQMVRFYTPATCVRDPNLK